MAVKSSPLQWTYLGMTLAGCCVASLFPPAARVAAELVRPVEAIWFATLAVTACAVCVEVLAADPRGYFAALCVHGACIMAQAPMAAGRLGLELALFGPFVLGVCLHNPFPVNCGISLLANGLIMAVRGPLMASQGAAPAAVLESELEYGLLCGALTAAAALMALYRERLAASQKENERLDGLVDRLTRLNLNYQEYARTVEEASIESERKRITRDIHDIVGYTLTNTITMMEAITDMMHLNPLGVSHLVELARSNAQEGLTQVRDALHVLRSGQVEYPTGVRAVERLLLLFQKATGVRVETAYTDVAWDFPDDLDSALYHLIQESLVNSFRHGKATRIRVSLTRRASGLELLITDNGVGADGFKEGIGLSGMRERLSRLGGSLAAGPTAGGFAVTATVPRGT
jgi:signal transduction histidine kinase